MNPIPHSSFRRSGRALLLMAKNGLITLKDLNNISATQKDIADNPKKLKIRELEAATLPRILSQVDLAVINTNYAIEAGLNPLKDSLFIEDASSPYANLLVAREDNANSPAMKKLAAALNSPEVKARLVEMEFDVVASSPKQFSDWIRTEITRWGKVIKSTGAKVE